MSIIPKLATSLNRRDEVPNQELAAEIVRASDAAAVAELVENLANKNKNIRNDCIKVLYEIGYYEPKLISGHIASFLKLLDSKDNRLQWGSMTALGSVVRERPDEVFAALAKIIDAADRGTVITRDNCVNILISLSAIKKYASQTFPVLLEQLMTCPTNQIPMYAEHTQVLINTTNKDAFVKVLSSRLNEIEKESKRKRVERVITKFEKFKRS